MNCKNNYNNEPEFDSELLSEWEDQLFEDEEESHLINSFRYDSNSDWMISEEFKETMHIVSEDQFIASQLAEKLASGEDLEEKERIFLEEYLYKSSDLLNPFLEEISFLDKANQLVFDQT